VTIKTLWVVSGVSVTVSHGDGWIAPPFQAGAMPDEVTAIVFVVAAPGMAVGINMVRSNVTVSGVTAEVFVNKEGATVSTDGTYAEVK
jgi:hypothetical protein